MSKLKQKEYNTELFDWLNGKDQDGFYFSGSLNIILTKKPKEISPNLLNSAAPADAKVKKVKFDYSINNINCNGRDVTDEELDKTIIYVNKIKITGRSGRSVTHDAPNSKNFTVRELFKAIEKTEFETRGDAKGKWFGGIDVHHVF